MSRVLEVRLPIDRADLLGGEALVALQAHQLGASISDGVLRVEADQRRDLALSVLNGVGIDLDAVEEVEEIGRAGLNPRQMTEKALRGADL